MTRQEFMQPVIVEVGRAMAIAIMQRPLAQRIDDAIIAELQDRRGEVN